MTKIIRKSDKIYVVIVAPVSTAPVITAPATTEPATTSTPITTNGAITVTTNATGATVSIISGTTVVATGTAVNGVAVIPNVPNGNYVVEVVLTGFNTATSVVVVNGDISINMNLEATTEFTATQIGRQKIIVTGENLTDKVADYTIKKGNTSVAMDTVTLSADKKSATLTSASSSLAAGSYTAEFGKDKYAFSVEAEKVTNIEVIGTNLVLDSGSNNSGTINFKVLNQFGEKTNATISASCTLVSNEYIQVAQQATKTVDGIIKITEMQNVVPGTTQGTLVLVDRETGANVSTTVTVSAEATINTIKVAGIYQNYTNPNKATKVEDFNSDANVEQYAVLLKAYDQYGTENEELFNSNTVTITPTGNTGITVDKENITTVTIGDETYIAIPLNASTLASGTTTLTIVGNTKGLLDTVTINVTKPISVASIKLSQSETLYNRTKSEVSFVAKDTNGEEVTDFDTLNALTTGIFNTNGHGKWEWSRQDNGSAKLYFTPNVTDNVASDTASQSLIVTTTQGTNVDIANFTIYNAKKVAAIIGFDNDTALAALKTTGTISLKAENFKLQDQYGNLLTDNEVAGLKPYIGVAYTGNASGFDLDSVKVGEASIKLAVDTEDYAYAQVTEKDTVIMSINTKSEIGKTKLKFVLSKDGASNNKIENSDYTVTVQSVDIEDVDDFAVEDITQLYVNPNSSESGEPVDLKVTGKMGTTTVALTYNDYSIVNDGTEHIEYNESGAIMTKANTNATDSADGKLTVYEKEGSTTYGSKTETLEIVIKNEAGTSIKKDIVVSSIAPKAAKVEAADEFKLSKELNQTIEVNDITELLIVKDQYDANYTLDANNEPRIQFTNVPNKFTVNDNNTKDASLAISNPENPTTVGTYTVGVTITYSSGVSFTDTLVITVGEVSLTTLKNNATLELEEYKSEDEYQGNSEAFKKAIADGKSNIESAQNQNEISGALKAAKDAIDAIDNDETLVNNVKAALESKTIGSIFGNNETASVALNTSIAGVTDLSGTPTISYSIEEEESVFTISEKNVLTASSNSGTGTLKVTIKVGNKTASLDFQVTAGEDNKVTVSTID